MVEVGIPVWHAKDTLCKCLDSLVAQTLDRFITCLSIDCDGEDYSDIIKKYQERGLKIRIINSEENGGPGMARQRILDTTQCDYIMFLDADDMLMPRAVEILYKSAKINNFDILRSSFIREEEKEEDKILPHNMGVITWFHGKIYKVSFLKENNIQFLPGLRIDEDAYFNLIAWNASKNCGEIPEVTYIWRFNKQSITRATKGKEYFLNTYMCYITSQVEGLIKLFQLTDNLSNSLIVKTIINIYNYYMKARFYQVDETQMN